MRQNRAGSKRIGYSPRKTRQRNNITGVAGVSYAAYWRESRGTAVHEFKVYGKDPETGRGRVRTVYIATDDKFTDEKYERALRKAKRLRREMVRDATA